MSKELSNLKGHFFGMDQYDIRPLDGKWWLVQNPKMAWGFEMDSAAEGIPAGSRIVPRDNAETDFASIPFIGMIMRLIGPPSGYGKNRAYGPAAVGHDELYTLGTIDIPDGVGGYVAHPITRKYADSAMNCMMKCVVKIKKSVIVERDPVEKEYYLVHVSPARRRIMYAALRMGGSGPWKRHGRPNYVYKDHP